MRLRFFLILMLTAGAGSPAATAATGGLTLATWNIEHLAEQDGSGCRPRNGRDYRAIREYLSTRRPDLIAFQEVENEAAARRVFDPSHYRVHISSRPAADLGTCYDSPDRQLRMQRTGFAVRRDLRQRHGLEVRRLPDYTPLGSDGVDSRWGVHLVLEPVASTGAAQPVIHLLSIHLKSGCAFDEPEVDDNPDCRVLSAQLPRLEHWIETRVRRQELFMILGDFNRQLDQLEDPVWLQLDDSEVCERQTASAPAWHCRPGSARFSHAADLEKARAGRAHPRPWNPRYPYAVDHIVYGKAVDLGIDETASTFDEQAADHSDHLPLFIRLDPGRVVPPR